MFQDPYTSLNPRMSVGEIVGEPFRIHPDAVPKGGRDRAVKELLELVGLDPGHVHRYPHQFSGGQRQRIGIARALAVKPQVLVCDEPVSALDVSVQGQVINLLEDLQDELGLSYLFIAHDLAVVRHIADEVAVMYLGRIVEHGTAADVYDHAAHPYTRALMSAVPVPDPAARLASAEIVLEGDIPSPADPPSGCRFHTRCWLAARLAAAGEPADGRRAAAVRDRVTGADRHAAVGHLAACHYAERTALTAAAERSHDRPAAGRRRAELAERSGPGRLPDWLAEDGIDAVVVAGPDLPEQLAGEPTGGRRVGAARRRLACPTTTSAPRSCRGNGPSSARR